MVPGARAPSGAGVADDDESGASSSVRWRSLSAELVVRILEYVVEAVPSAETARLWPVRRVRRFAERGAAHLTTSAGEAFAIRAADDFDVVLRQNNEEDDERQRTFVLKGYWAAATPTSVRSFLCAREADVDVERVPSLRGERVFWLRRGVSDKGARRVMCCSLSRDVVRGGLERQRSPSTFHDAERSVEERVVDVDVVGLDYGREGQLFTYVPRGATLSRALRRRFALTVSAKHRFAEFVHANDGTGYWVTNKDHHHTLASELDTLLRLRNKLRAVGS